MSSFDPDTFAITLKKNLPNARVRVEHHSAEECEAARAALHTINAYWNHNAALGQGLLNDQPTERK